MRSKELQKQLDEAKSALELLQARRDGELSRLQREIREGEEYFERLVIKDREEIERLENELKAEVSKEKASWKKWPQAELIRRWETGDFDYEHFKDTENAPILRHAYKACMPDAGPRSVSRIMRVSAQVAAGWYKNPLEAPHCNPPQEKSDEASPRAITVKAHPAKKTPVKAAPSKIPPKTTIPAKNTPGKSTPAKTTPAKTTSAKANKPKTTKDTPGKDATVAKTVKSPAEKLQPKKTAVKKASKKNTTEKTTAEQTQTEPSKTATPVPVGNKKRAHGVAAVAGEMDEEDSQKQHASKKVKTAIQQ